MIPQHPYQFDFDLEIATERQQQSKDAVNEISRALEPFRGGNVQVWSYHVSHCWLEIRLSKSGVPGNVHLFCGVCFSVSFNPDYENSNLHISESTDDDGTPCYLVQDTDRLRVCCDQLAVKQNVEPVYNA